MFMFDLAGYENQSIWGYDQPMQTFFAQIWRNDSKNDEPDLWLSGVMPRYPTKEHLAIEVSRALNITLEDAVKALREE